MSSISNDDARDALEVIMTFLSQEKASDLISEIQRIFSKGKVVALDDGKTEKSYQTLTFQEQLAIAIEVLCNSLGIPHLLNQAAQDLKCSSVKIDGLEVDSADYPQAVNLDLSLKTLREIVEISESLGLKTPEQF
jgi:hypothetical protein